MRIARVSLVLAATLALLAGCSRNTETTPSDAGAQPAPAQPAPAQPGQPGQPGGALPPGHPPIGEGGAAPQGMPPQGSPQLVPPKEGSGTGETGLSWKVPEGWQVEAPSSQMRRAQYRVGGPAGDAECAVFYFGPNEGGDTMSNVQRWAAQFPKADGSPAEARTKDITVGSLPVTLVEIDGTFAGGMGGMAQAAPKENYKLLGAVAKGPDANWFFKFTGPKATVEAQRSAFDQLVKSLKPGA